MALPKQVKQAQTKAPTPLCPKCRSNVLVTGWTETAVQTRTYMSFHHRGAVMVAQTIAAAEEATCNCCGAALTVAPVELQRIA